ncbi:hypothetical protein CSPAE12_02191 [Colletotrichum incanum]|nr:hypothetical protein CSPAE12_02191 [Colletotrichum incanum]
MSSRKIKEEEQKAEEEIEIL